jgi:glutathione S-transferase
LKALALARLPFEDVRIPYPEFSVMKAAGVLPFDSLPILEVGEGDDKIVLSQSNAILNYVARIGGLVPADPIQAAFSDIAMEAIEDFWWYVRRGEACSTSQVTMMWRCPQHSSDTYADGGPCG